MNWSLMLNVLLLIGVVVAIVRTVQTRRQHESQKSMRNTTATAPAPQQASTDEIIAIRKVGQHNQATPPLLKPNVTLSFRQHTNATLSSLNKPEGSAPLSQAINPNIAQSDSKPAPSVEANSSNAESIMIFLLAKSNRQLAGYELLQAVLSAGFRFGEGGLFHRHQSPNCQGPIMCSLAAATPTGVFDLQNIGAFVVHGLCLFMQISGSRDIDAERFDVMLDTARTLSDSLDTHLLDETREQLSEQSIIRYHQRLMLNEEPVAAE